MDLKTESNARQTWQDTAQRDQSAALIPFPNVTWPGIRMKNHNDLGLVLPIVDVFGDELKVKDGGRQIAFKGQSHDAERRLQLRQSHGYIDVKGLR